jgi:hypothetical protein
MLFRLLNKRGYPLILPFLIAILTIRCQSSGSSLFAGYSKNGTSANKEGHVYIICKVILPILLLPIFLVLFSWRRWSWKTGMHRILQMNENHLKEMKTRWRLKMNKDKWVKEWRMNENENEWLEMRRNDCEPLEWGKIKEKGKKMKKSEFSNNLFIIRIIIFDSSKLSIEWLLRTPLPPSKRGTDFCTANKKIEKVVGVCFHMLPHASHSPTFHVLLHASAVFFQCLHQL